MAWTLSLLYLFVLGVCVLETNAQPWLCPTAGNCAQSLGEEFNETLAQIDDSYVIEFCLKKKDFQTSCLNEAVVDCEWAGDEEEYYRLRSVQRNTQGKCSELCPVMEDLQLCPSHVNNVLFFEKKFHQFCNSYKESLDCKTTALSGGSQCSFGEKLFSRGFDDDTIRVFEYICESGCADIDTAWDVLERCTTTHNLNLAGSQCKTYQDLELCLSTSQTCPQIHMMARYFARNYTDYVMKCPLPMPVMKTTTSSEQKTEELDPVLTDETPLPELTDDTTFSKLEGNSKPNQDPIEETKEMVTKELSTTTVKVSDGGTVSTSDVCLSTIQSLGPISITDSVYCDSVLCLVGQGVQFDDVSLMELEDVLEQKLLERWNSCGSAVTADVSDTTTDKPTHDVKEMATETRDNTVQDVTDSAITTNNPARVTTSIITKTTNIPTPFLTDMKTELTTAIYKAEDTQALETSRGPISGDRTGPTSALKTTTKYAPRTDTTKSTNLQTKPLPATFSKTENIDTSVGKLFDDENKGFIVIDKLQTIYPSTSDHNDRYSTNTLSYLLTSITPFGFSSVSSIQSNSAATSNSNEKDVESAPENAGANTDSRENLENVASRQNMAFFPICIVFVCTRNYL
eukprot:XP_011415199.1 PREDICTED: uncharacterized protein LOC105319378 isoform X2 [Crassostrea gigas]